MADTPNRTAELMRVHDPVQITEHIAVAAFIAGYTGGTRVSYTTDLRIFAEWCRDSGFNLLNARLHGQRHVLDVPVDAAR
jgi:hypothetical protein